MLVYQPTRYRVVELTSFTNFILLPKLKPLMRNGKWQMYFFFRLHSGTQEQRFVLLLPITADCFNRTTEHRFFTQRFFFFCLWLLEHKRVIVLVGTHKISRCRVATYITVDAGRVDVIFAGNIFLNAIVFVRQLRNPLSLNTYPQITQISQIQNNKLAVIICRPFRVVCVPKANSGPSLEKQSAIANRQSPILMGVSSLPA